jgi:hypothetical protein
VVHWTLSICFLVGFLALRVGFSSCFSNNKWAVAAKPLLVDD